MRVEKMNTFYFTIPHGCGVRVEFLDALAALGAQGRIRSSMVRVETGTLHRSEVEELFNGYIEWPDKFRDLCVVEVRELNELVS